MCCNYDSNDDHLGFYLSLFFFFFFVALKPDPLFARVRSLVYMVSLVACRSAGTSKLFVNGR